ncbi:hypothetical protein B7P43_G04829 [Cryptotermes secundus]|uniref:Uncharacterized protein n=1 Tax=Cryptotermes secundus TaxID=105785 RepID=A0A2J7R381_9NEOP|nr:hypothetical protein B7P43_G04829 [Cryptotermes secundus]
MSEGRHSPGKAGKNGGTIGSCTMTAPLIVQHKFQPSHSHLILLTSLYEISIS